MEQHSLALRSGVKSVTVTYTSAKGTAPEDLSSDTGHKLTEEELPTLEADGYVMTGWYSGETLIEPGYQLTDDGLDLVAEWEEATEDDTTGDTTGDAGGTT